MDGIRSWIEAEGSGHWFFVAFPVVLVCLFIWFKGRRVRFLIPSLIMSIVIINPLFYKYWDELGLYAYWRILWVIPVIPVVAGLVPSISEQFEKTWVKSIVAVAGVGAVMVGGTFLYNGVGGSFTVAANASKEPDYVVQIADRLLELDEHPRVIAQDPIGVYIRQYSGAIDTLFGRDMHGYIKYPSADAMEVSNKLLIGDNAAVSQYMLNEGYDYLIYDEDPGEQFRLIDNVSKYGIYSAVGVPEVIKKRNENGQVVSLMYVDGNGKNINKDGYSTVEYEYNRDGYVEKEVRRSVSNSENQRSMTDRYMAEHISAVYHNMHLIYEAYYDEEGNIIPQPAGHVAIEQEWDGDSLVSRTYLGLDGMPVNRIDGYAKVVWKEDDAGVIRMALYDAEGNIVDNTGVNLAKGIKIDSDGWTKWFFPQYGAENHIIIIGDYNFGESKEGDFYTYSFEIEFRDVTPSNEDHFSFRTAGPVDNRWDYWQNKNPWNFSLLDIEDNPDDGVYTFTKTIRITDEMLQDRLKSIGFRCDYWKSGMFRVRNVKIEKGNTATEWTPGP